MMNSIRKTVVAIILVLSAALLCACGGDFTPSPSPSDEKEYKITVSDTSLYLALSEIGQGEKTSETVTATVTENGVVIPDAVVTAASGNESVCTVEGNVVKAVGKGRTIVAFTFEKDGQTVTTEVVVDVYIPVDENTIKEDVIFDLSTSEGGYITVPEFVNCAESLVLLDGDDELRVRKQDGQFVIPSDEFETGEREMLLCGSTVSYKFNCIVATSIIRTADDLFALKGTIDGYYILANDIDAKNNAEPMYFSAAGNVFETNTIKSEGGTFRGGFDGRGYTIFNLNVGSYGLFGALGGKASVKNLGLVNVKAASGDYNCALACANAAPVENIFVTGNVKELIHYSIGPNNRLENIVAILPGSDAVIVKNAASVDTDEVVGYGKANVSEFFGLTIVCGSASPKVSGFSRTAEFNGISHDSARKLHAYSSVNSLKNAGVDFGYLGKYWDISGDFPVFISSKQ